MKGNKIYKIIFFSLMLFLIAGFALAQDIGFGEKTKNIVKDFGKTVGYETGNTITNDAFLEIEISSIIKYILGFIGIIFFSLVLYSGFQWMTAGGNEEKTGEAKQRITQASIGLTLVIIAYLIVFWVFNFFYSQSGAQTNCTDNNNEKSDSTFACMSNAQCTGFSGYVVNGLCENNTGICCKRKK